MKKIVFFLCIFLLSISECYALCETSSSCILLDMDNNRVLVSKNINNRRLIASITKIMTSVIAIESGKLDDIVTVDESILPAYGSGIYINIGEEMSLRDLLYGLMLRSGNDAALMIAGYIAGSEEEFAKKMNEKAVELGMKNTIFVNSSGLDTASTGNYSTAYDMAILTSYAMKNEEYRNIVKTKNYTVKSNQKTFVWHNKNRLLDLDYVTGGKTGFTERAKRTLVTTATIDNMNLVVVTLNDGDDWGTHKSLYEYAAFNYKNYNILDSKNFSVLDDLYYKNLYIKEDYSLTLNNEEIELILSKIKLTKLDNYKDGDIVGINTIYLNNIPLKTIDIYVKKEVVAEKNFISKVIDWIKFW